MAITRAQQAKQLLALGGRIGLQGNKDLDTKIQDDLMILVMVSWKDRWWKQVLEAARKRAAAAGNQKEALAI